MTLDSGSKPVALMVGATGLVGREILRQLGRDSRIGEVRALVRRPLSDADKFGTIKECLVDFDHLEDTPDLFKVDWVFCALGTTIAVAGSRAAFRKVDFEYPMAIARVAKAGGARYFGLVSAVGAHRNSWIFYSRVKGELETALGELGYESLAIARPSLLLGERQEKRIGEEIAVRLAWLTPAPWKPVFGSQVAAALIESANDLSSGVKILKNRTLRLFEINNRNVGG